MTRKDPNGTGDDVPAHVKMAAELCNIGGRLEAVLLEGDTAWDYRFREARAILSGAEGLVDEGEAAWVAEVGRNAGALTLTPADDEATRRVIACLEQEALEHGAGWMGVFWKTIAANLRHEFLDDAGAARGQSRVRRPVGEPTPAEFDSCRRVTAAMEAEAESARPQMHALWQRAAANVRREVLVPPLPEEETPLAFDEIECDALQRISLSLAEASEAMARDEASADPTRDLAAAARWRQFSETLATGDYPRALDTLPRVIEDELDFLAFSGRTERAKELQGDPTRRWEFVQGCATVLGRLAANED